MEAGNLYAKLWWMFNMDIERIVFDVGEIVEIVLINGNPMKTLRVSLNPLDFEKVYKYSSINPAFRVNKINEDVHGLYRHEIEYQGIIFSTVTEEKIKIMREDFLGYEVYTVGCDLGENNGVKKIL